MQERKPISIVKKLLTAVIIPIIFFILLEGGARFAGIEVIPSTLEQDPQSQAIDLMKKRGIFTEDPLLFWRFIPIDGKETWLVPGKLWINMLGLRSTQNDFSKPVDLRIIALGDSCTFGWKLASDSTYPSLVEKGLREIDPDRRIDVINAGVPGYSSYQTRLQLETELIGIKSHLALIMLGWNDIWGRSSKPDCESENSKVTRLIRTKLLNLRFIELLRCGIEKLTPTKNIHGGSVRVSPDQFRENITAIIYLCRSKDIRPILLLQPHRPLPHTECVGELLHPRMDEYNSITKDLGNILKVPVIDIPKRFKREPNQVELFMDCIHLTAEGTEILANTVLESLRQNGI